MVDAAQDEVDAIFKRIVANIRKRDPTFADAAGVDEAVDDLLKLFGGLTLENTGKIMNRDGTDALEVWGP